MFDLEKSIVEWRTRMVAAGVTTPAPLEELELHLRDEIEQQMKSGLSEPKAFELAAATVGPAGLLTREFQKINHGERTPRQKRIAAIMFALVLGFYSLALTWALLAHDLAFGERLSGFGSLATLIGLVFLARQVLPRFSPIITSKAAQSALGLIGGVSGAVWFVVFAWLILPRCDFTVEQMRMAIYWAIVPTLVLPTIAFLVLDKSESQLSVTANS